MSPGHVLRVVPLEAGDPGHLFGGEEPDAPDCPWCGHPLTRDFLLDAGDPRLGIAGLERLPLLYCHRCRMRGWIAYRPGQRALVAHDGAPGARGVLRRTFWRLGLRLEPLPPDLPDLYRRHRGVPREEIADRRLMGWLATAPHQVGGPLWWPEDRSLPSCPLCGAAPSELGMLFSDPGRGMGYGESGMVHMGLCAADGLVVISGR